MQQYLEVLKDVMRLGVRQENRTGIATYMIPGAMMKFDLFYGFPILTTKKVAFNQVKGELLGFIRGYDDANEFRKLGCTIWDANANENKEWLGNPYRLANDHLGRIYGMQWRDWRGSSYSQIDQLRKAVDMIRHSPTSRRIIVTAWNPSELHMMALPPCHLLYQFLVEQTTRKLHMTMYMRSCDMFLGVPFNISSYALLLCLVADEVNMVPGTLTMFLADVHIYENHLDQVHELIVRSPRALPELVLKSEPVPDGAMWLDYIEPHHIELLGYDPHPAIKAEMAV
jgi:thymidylate synthase